MGVLASGACAARGLPLPLCTHTAASLSLRGECRSRSQLDWGDVFRNEDEITGKLVGRGRCLLLSAMVPFTVFHCCAFSFPSASVSFFDRFWASVPLRPLPRRILLWIFVEHTVVLNCELHSGAARITFVEHTVVLNCDDSGSPRISHLGLQTSPNNLGIPGFELWVPMGPLPSGPTHSTTNYCETTLP